MKTFILKIGAHTVRICAKTVRGAKIKAAHYYNYQYVGRGVDFIRLIDCEEYIKYAYCTMGVNSNWIRCYDSKCTVKQEVEDIERINSLKMWIL